MTALLAAHAGALLVTTAAAFVLTLGGLIWALAHLEKRTQWLEHEMAKLHVDNEVAQPPAAPEVTRRLAQMTSDEQAEAA